MMLLSVIALASGCAATIRAGVPYCEHARTIRWESQAELDATPTPIVRQVVLNNETVERLCR